MVMLADYLLNLMYEWLQEARDCSSNLRALAQELESLREGCNVAEMVGSTLTVVGAGATAAAAAPFTLGTSIAVAGAVAGGVGTTISVVSKVVEFFETNDKLKRVKKIDERCNRIAEDIREFYENLRAQCPSGCKEEQDMYVLKEMLKAMSRRRRQNIDTKMKDLDHLLNYLKNRDQLKRISRILKVSVVGALTSVLLMFSVMLRGKVLTAAAKAGGEKIAKRAMTKSASKLGATLMSAAAKSGGKKIGTSVAIRGASRILGGVVGLAFSLPEAIESWTNAIENNHKTEASQSVRDIAKEIEKATKKLSSNLSKIEKVAAAIACSGAGASPDPPDDNRESSSSSESGSESSSESESDEEKEKEELRIGLINARSAKKFISQNNMALIDLIVRNNLDVLLITETWLPLNQIIGSEFRRVLPQNYNVLSNPRFYGRGGGVAMVFNERAFRLRHVPFNVTADTFEFAAGSLRRSGNNEPILFLNIYRPPNPSVPLKKFIEELRALLSSVYASFKLVIIGGDFNIWMDRPESNDARLFQDLLNDFNLRQFVSGPTHNRGHTLDLVLARSDVGINIESVEQNSFSDHRTIVFRANMTLQFHRNSNDDLKNLIKGILSGSLLLRRKRKGRKGKKRRKRTYKKFDDRQWKKK